MIQIVQRGDLFRSYIVSLTLGDRTVYNIDSKQFYCDKSEFYKTDYSKQQNVYFVNQMLIMR